MLPCLSTKMAFIFGEYHFNVLLLSLWTYVVFSTLTVRRVHVCTKSFQSCPTLCDPMDHSLPGSSVHGIFQERIPEWVAISYSRVSPWLRDRTCISCSVGNSYHWAPWEALRGKPPQKYRFQGKKQITLSHRTSVLYSNKSYFIIRQCEFSPEQAKMHIPNWLGS